MNERAVVFICFLELSLMQVTKKRDVMKAPHGGRGGLNLFRNALVGSSGKTSLILTFSRDSYPLATWGYCSVVALAFP